jgi:hypothetical protein
MYFPINVRTNRYLNAPTDLAVTTVSARTAALPVGQYRVTAIGGTVYFRRGDSSVTATTSDSPICDGTSILLDVTSADVNFYIAAIVASGTATLFFDRLE